MKRPYRQVGPEGNEKLIPLFPPLKKGDVRGIFPLKKGAGHPSEGWVGGFRGVFTDEKN